MDRTVVVGSMPLIVLAIRPSAAEGDQRDGHVDAHHAQRPADERHRARYARLQPVPGQQAQPLGASGQGLVCEAHDEVLEGDEAHAYACVGACVCAVYVRRDHVVLTLRIAAAECEQRGGIE